MALKLSEFAPTGVPSALLNDIANGSRLPPCGLRFEALLEPSYAVGGP